MSDERNQDRPTLFFLHIPKTGGRTLLQLARKQYDRSRVFEVYGNLDEKIREYRSLPSDKRDSIDLVAGHYAFGLHRGMSRPFTYVTMLRDPVQRAVSDYRYQRRQRHWRRDGWEKEELSIQEVLEKGAHILMDNGQTRVLSSARDQVPFGHCDASHLEEAKSNLAEHFSVVGIMERFNESFVAIKRECGWKGWLVRPVNVSREKDDTITRETERRLRELNELDRELYRFACDLLDERLSNRRGATALSRLVAGVSTLGAFRDRLRAEIRKRSPREGEGRPGSGDRSA